ncbi:MAG: hypothetical protein L6264_09605 [Weeksellaceae bacterium]|uniref:hypothetical protein n=1 Tax=Kaistella soli TaxID=2849654 RepID=UPI001182AC10|nr:hypothetical protein [Kaistella soli]MBU4537875.1 hypothetical protein [Bacteroidota bacterium]MBU8881825.1 hypothetical protein [Kaistella soli]MCG2781194.1 hypothetical protein [Weeksellaceae bacterium]
MKIKINGFEYTKEEVLEGLKEKGYLILKHTIHVEKCINGCFHVRKHYHTECALKGEDLPDENTQWHHVASKVFKRFYSKPPLV